MRQRLRAHVKAYMYLKSSSHSEHLVPLEEILDLGHVVLEVRRMELETFNSTVEPKQNKARQTRSQSP